MAKSEARRTKRDNAVVTYVKETRAELRKVHWPSQEEARTLTIVVLGVTILMAALLGFLDFVFAWLMAGIINLNPVAIIVSALLVAGMGTAGYVLLRGE
jgi:preprotein translocase subunit SecE